MAKATGNQGNWFAKISAPQHPEIDGQSLPCVWDWWYDGRGRYNDPEYAPERSKTMAVVDALKLHGLAVMRRRKRGTAPDVWEAEGYIAVFRVQNVECKAALTFDVIERVCELK